MCEFRHAEGAIYAGAEAVSFIQQAQSSFRRGKKGCRKAIRSVSIIICKVNSYPQRKTSGTVVVVVESWRKSSGPGRRSAHHRHGMFWVEWRTSHHGVAAVGLRGLSRGRWASGTLPSRCRPNMGVLDYLINVGGWWRRHGGQGWLGMGRFVCWYNRWSGASDDGFCAGNNCSTGHGSRQHRCC